jgi:hypothetical protein
MTKKAIFYIIFVSIFFVGCANNNAQSTIKSNSTKKDISTKNRSEFKSNSIVDKELKIINKDGILKIVDKNKHYILASCGLDYNAHLNENKNILVVDVLLLTNLQTIKIFKKRKNQRFKKTNKKAHKYIWERFLKNKSFSYKDIEYPKLQFRDWVDNDTFEVELWGEVNGKVIKDILRYDIK